MAAPRCGHDDDPQEGQAFIANGQETGPSIKALTNRDLSSAERRDFGHGQWWLQIAVNADGVE